MKTRRFIMIAAAVAAVIIGACFATDRFIHRNRTVDTSKLIAALQAFSRDRVASGQQLPATVSLRELLGAHYLTATDVRAFDGLEVTFSLTADESRPQQIMIEARLPDGTRIASLADGSATQLPKKLMPLSKSPTSAGSGDTSTARFAPLARRGEAF